MNFPDALEIVYFSLVLWIFIPLIFMFLLSGITMIFKIKKIDIIFRNALRIFLGMGNYEDDYSEKIIYQFKGLDCGSVALENTLFLMDGIQRDVILPSPSSMFDLYDVSTKLGFHSKGITEMSIDRLREIILEKDTKCIVLLNAFYPFVGLWVRLTRIMLKILIGRQKALHWVVVHKVDANRIVFIDPYFGYVKMPMRFFKDAWSKTALVIRK